MNDRPTPSDQPLYRLVRGEVWSNRYDLAGRARVVLVDEISEAEARMIADWAWSDRSAALSEVEAGAYGGSDDRYEPARGFTQLYLWLCGHDLPDVEHASVCREVKFYRPLVGRMLGQGRIDEAVDEVAALPSYEVFNVLATFEAYGRDDALAPQIEDIGDERSGSVPS